MKRRRRRGELRAIRPNAGLEDLYARKLDALVEAMGASVRRWLMAKYRAKYPQIAQDAAVDDLQDTIEELADAWRARFDKTAENLAGWFARGAQSAGDAQLKSILRKGGYTVRFTMTQAQQNIIAATVQANVALIRSIPSEYFTQIEGIVMRGVQSGRDVGQVSRDLQQQLGVTKRRADLIAKDQNNKATSALQEARQKELGIEEGIWIHSGGGKEPRPKHVAANGKKFKLGVGLKVGDKGQWVMPGIEINCRCVWRPVVPGF